MFTFFNSWASCAYFYATLFKKVFYASRKKICQFYLDSQTSHLALVIDIMDIAIAATVSVFLMQIIKVFDRDGDYYVIAVLPMITCALMTFQ